MAHPLMIDLDDPLLEWFRTIALSFPEAQEKISHGRPSFFTKKIFTIFGGTLKLASGEMEQRPHAMLILPDAIDEYSRV